jgi:hypothetical protein
MMARAPWSNDGRSRRLEYKAFCDDMGGCLPDLDLGHTLPDLPAVHDAAGNAHVCDYLVFVSFGVAVGEAADLDTDTSLGSVRMKKQLELDLSSSRRHSILPKKEIKL